MPEVKEGGEFWFGKNGPPVLFGIQVNLESVISNQQNSGFMIRFANQLKKRRYIHPREFFEYLSFYESKELFDTTNEASIFIKQSQSDFDKYRTSMNKIITCICLLAKAEGEPVLTVPQIYSYIENFAMLVILHKLHTEGTIKAKYENFTILGTDRPLFDTIIKDEKPEDKAEPEPPE